MLLNLLQSIERPFSDGLEGDYMLSYTFDTKGNLVQVIEKEDKGLTIDQTVAQMKAMTEALEKTGERATAACFFAAGLIYTDLVKEYKKKVILDKTLLPEKKEKLMKILTIEYK